LLNVEIVCGALFFRSILFIAIIVFVCISSSEGNDPTFVVGGAFKNVEFVVVECDSRVLGAFDSVAFAFGVVAVHVDFIEDEFAFVLVVASTDEQAALEAFEVEQGAAVHDAVGEVFEFDAEVDEGVHVSHVHVAETLLVVATERVDHLVATLAAYVPHARLNLELLWLDVDVPIVDLQVEPVERVLVPAAVLAAEEEEEALVFDQTAATPARLGVVEAEQLAPAEVAHVQPLEHGVQVDLLAPEEVELVSVQTGRLHHARGSPVLDLHHLHAHGGRVDLVEVFAQFALGFVEATLGLNLVVLDEGREALEFGVGQELEFGFLVGLVVRDGLGVLAAGHGLLDVLVAREAGAQPSLVGVEVLAVLGLYHGAHLRVVELGSGLVDVCGAARVEFGELGAWLVLRAVVQVGAARGGGARVEPARTFGVNVEAARPVAQFQVAVQRLVHVPLDVR